MLICDHMLRTTHLAHCSGSGPGPQVKVGRALWSSSTTSSARHLHCHLAIASTAFTRSIKAVTQHVVIDQYY